MYAGIEAGGTKMVCAVANVDEITREVDLVERVSIPTTTPDETIAKMIDFFKKYEISGLGIGCFGPLDLDKSSDTYGYITSTPKDGWENTDMLTPFREAFGIDPVIDTDVNGAILGEVLHGSAKGCESAIYITIGTGIGVGVYVNGGLLHGMMHPEAGHMLIDERGVLTDRIQVTERARIGSIEETVESNKSTCKRHCNCFEGLACGPAIEKRWGKPAFELLDQEDVWELESDYIAQAMMNYILCYSPQKIVIWGGVMHVPGLLDKVRDKTHRLLGGYIEALADRTAIDTLIVEPALGENPGIIGAIELGRIEIDNNN